MAKIKMEEANSGGYVPAGSVLIKNRMLQNMLLTSYIEDSEIK